MRPNHIVASFRPEGLDFDYNIAPSDEASTRGKQSFRSPSDKQLYYGRAFSQKSSFGFWTNIYLLVPSIFIVSTFLGAIFYSLYHGWDMSTAFFYSSNVLLGVLYLVPEETDGISQAFTLCFYLFGSSIIAGAVGAFASTLVARAARIKSEARQEARSTNEHETVHSHSDAKAALVSGKSDVGVTSSTWSEAVTDRISLIGSYILPKDRQIELSSAIGWRKHRSKYLAVLAALVWLVVGVAYGMLFEGWGFLMSLYFAIGAMSCAGIPSPTMDSCKQIPFVLPDGSMGSKELCQLGFARGTLISLYLIVGVPLFAFALGQISGFVVEQAVREEELKIMSRPLGKREFDFACSLHNTRNNAWSTADPMHCRSAIPRSWEQMQHLQLSFSADASTDEDDPQHEMLASKQSYSIPLKYPLRDADVADTTAREKLVDDFTDKVHVTAGAAGSPRVRELRRAIFEPAGSSNLSSGEEGRRLSIKNSPSMKSREDDCVYNRDGGDAGLKAELIFVGDAEEADYDFCFDFGDFVVLELLRLKRVDFCDLRAIKDLFDDIDDDGSGYITKEKLLRYHQSLVSPRQDFTPNLEINGDIRITDVNSHGEGGGSATPLASPTVAQFQKLRQSVPSNLPDDLDYTHHTHQKKRFFPPEGTEVGQPIDEDRVCAQLQAVDNTVSAVVDAVPPVLDSVPAVVDYVPTVRDSVPPVLDSVHTDYASTLIGARSSTSSGRIDNDPDGKSRRSSFAIPQLSFSQLSQPLAEVSQEEIMRGAVSIFSSGSYVSLCTSHDGFERHSSSELNSARSLKEKEKDEKIESEQKESESLCGRVRGGSEVMKDEDIFPLQIEEESTASALIKDRDDEIETLLATHHPQIAQSPQAQSLPPPWFHPQGSFPSRSPNSTPLRSPSATLKKRSSYRPRAPSVVSADSRIPSPLMHQASTPPRLSQGQEHQLQRASHSSAGTLDTTQREIGRGRRQSTPPVHQPLRSSLHHKAFSALFMPVVLHRMTKGLRQRQQQQQQTCDQHHGHRNFNNEVQQKGRPEHVDVDKSLPSMSAAGLTEVDDSKMDDDRLSHPQINLTSRRIRSASAWDAQAVKPSKGMRADPTAIPISEGDSALRRSLCGYGSLNAPSPLTSPSHSNPNRSDPHLRDSRQATFLPQWHYSLVQDIDVRLPLLPSTGPGPGPRHESSSLTPHLPLSASYANSNMTLCSPKNETRVGSFSSTASPAPQRRPFFPVHRSCSAATSAAVPPSPSPSFTRAPLSPYLPPTDGQKPENKHAHQEC